MRDHDEETAVALREAGLPVSNAVTTAEAYRAYAIQAQAISRRAHTENERRLKGFYVDWVFDSLNVSKYR